uniref:Uncharacterized protein n=1 Tax=Siphoviridae sp. ct87j35 TaxID=2825356 RepID=A0A8S5V4M9_9CAUD|nr:MAG TPA: hypothetical protein [Siphoviridae sp. ct87j35]
MIKFVKRHVHSIFDHCTPFFDQWYHPSSRYASPPLTYASPLTLYDLIL